MIEAADGDNEIRPLPDHFTPWQDKINAALAALPPDGHGAVIAVADTHEIKLAFVARAGDHWSFMIEGSKPYDDEVEGAVAVRFSF